MNATILFLSRGETVHSCVHALSTLLSERSRLAGDKRGEFDLLR
jgi:hypothetical protein